MKTKNVLKFVIFYLNGVFNFPAMCVSAIPFILKPLQPEAPDVFLFYIMTVTLSLAMFSVSDLLSKQQESCHK